MSNSSQILIHFPINFQNVRTVFQMLLQALGVYMYMPHVLTPSKRCVALKTQQSRRGGWGLIFPLMPMYATT